MITYRIITEDVTDEFFIEIAKAFIEKLPVPDVEDHFGKGCKLDFVKEQCGVVSIQISDNDTFWWYCEVELDFDFDKDEMYGTTGWLAERYNS